VTAVWAVALAVAAPPQVLAVRLVSVEGRPALRILTTAPTDEVQVTRENGEVVVSLPAEGPDGLALPEPVAPLLGVTRGPASGRFVLRVRIAPEVPFETRREDALTTVLFGEQPPADLRPPVEQLYRRLFPTGTTMEPNPHRPEPAEANPEAPAAFRLGRVAFRPYALVSYLNADTVSGNPPQAIGDQYIQVQPGVSADTPLGLGRLTVSYDPRLRAFSSSSAVQPTTHWLNAGLDLPVGSRVQLRATEHFSKGVLEATEVDPGKEYFFDLGAFRRFSTEVSGRIEVAPRVSAELGAHWNDVKVEPDAAFFSYRGYGSQAGLAYEISPNLRLGLAYTYAHFPRPANRPEAEATAHGAALSLSGEVAPLTAGRAEIAYTAQDTPNAGAGGTRYRGLTASAGLRRDLGPTAALDLSMRRTLDPSAFENNGFYIATLIESVLTLPGPYRTYLRGGLGYQWSDYRTQASAIAEPRADRLLAWYAGLGRLLGERAGLRVDYRRERRSSNLPGFDITTNALVVQVSLGWLAGGAAP
jgi:hypothetical protein